MKLTSRMLRAIAVAGVATVAPLVAAMPAHAGLGIPQGPATATADLPPGPGAIGPEFATELPPGPNAVGSAYVASLPPGPSADIIAI